MMYMAAAERTRVERQTLSWYVSGCPEIRCMLSRDSVVVAEARHCAVNSDQRCMTWIGACIYAREADGE
jgi:hypothetical protein